jgi:hypothetical protein
MSLSRGLYHFRPDASMKLFRAGMVLKQASEGGWSGAPFLAFFARSGSLEGWPTSCFLIESCITIRGCPTLRAFRRVSITDDDISAWLKIRQLSRKL